MTIRPVGRCLSDGPVPIQDPLDASIMDFLAALDAQLETDESTLCQGAVHLYQLIKHFIKS